jgi:RNA polymerase sigma-70 factor (ECF subfamily)
MECSQALIERAAAGDPIATAELIASVWPDAYRLAWSILKDRSAAEDAAQEGCARAWCAMTQLRRPERFPIWFYRIVVNESLRLLRARPPEPIAEPAAYSDSAVAQRLDVRAAIDSLDSRLRLAVLLRYYFELNSSEIARVVGASPVTVRWRLMLAHRRLRSLLEEYASPSLSPTQNDERYGDESVATS